MPHGNMHQHAFLSYPGLCTLDKTDLTVEREGSDTKISSRKQKKTSCLEEQSHEVGGVLDVALVSQLFPEGGVHAVTHHLEQTQLRVLRMQTVHTQELLPKCVSA